MSVSLRSDLAPEASVCERRRERQRGVRGGYRGGGNRDQRCEVRVVSCVRGTFSKGFGARGSKLIVSLHVDPSELQPER